MKINKQSLEEQATEYIREMITDGQLEQGTKIVESTLSKELELSRSTVRMALNSLSHEGLVVQKPYVGWHVFTLDDEELWELYNMRVAIESQAAAMAAERATAQDKEELIELLNEFCRVCDNGEDSLAIYKMDFDFHQKVVELSHSPRFAKIYAQIANQLKSYIEMTHIEYDLSQSGLSHKPLVDAICAGDAEKAWKEAKENITSFAELAGKSVK
ncbi:GntR family transcriptional regulator [Vibrio alfacsensis]|uniref:GntR family transcriptional regulator n=1 Tax=Vibrio alfacsensis TaxID=1074311 RepID=UPI002ADD6CA2|nr:GntR family transcriptional regulator [Vibrio alfacsensis]WQE78618.1 GntR family transcriptional regulator [Vibrio alfacsensis]